MVGDATVGTFISPTAQSSIADTVGSRPEQPSVLRALTYNRAVMGVDSSTFGNTFGAILSRLVGSRDKTSWRAMLICLSISAFTTRTKIWNWPNADANRRRSESRASNTWPRLAKNVTRVSAHAVSFGARCKNNVDTNSSISRLTANAGYTGEQGNKPRCTSCRGAGAHGHIRRSK